MAAKATLDPDIRLLYGNSLRPPLGYVFDSGVGTTYSLDFETALAVPVCLALFSAENRDDINLLALLEGAERIAGRLLVFCEVGRIQAETTPQSRLCSLLETMIVEAAAPRGGAFHPKLWVLRFKPEQDDGPVRMRLMVLSRNLTRDRSWDMALTLDGVVGNRPHAVNRPLADLLKRLPDLAEAPPDGALDLVADLAEDVRRTDWDLPEGFDSVEFAVNGLGGRLWQPDGCARLGIVSPFCDEEALALLSKVSRQKPVLISRSEELLALPAGTLDAFSQVLVLDEMAESEDGEDAPASSRGLHAKILIRESGWDTLVTVGSGNATRPALISGNNVEVFATLTGKRSKVGGIEENLGAHGFGRLLRPFVAGEAALTDAEDRAAEARLEEARRTLCRVSLRLRCEPADTAGEDGEAWRIWLTVDDALPLPGLAALSVWPITRGQAHRRDILKPLRQGQAVDLGAMPLADVTRFLAFDLTDSAKRASVLFTRGLVLEGLPEARHAAILRGIINSREAFLRYLRLLLAESGDPFAAALLAQQTGTGSNGWGQGADDVPLLEEMVRALCQGCERLHAVRRLLERLDDADSHGDDVVPPDFRGLWDAFRATLPE